MKKVKFETENSIGHIEVNESGSGGALFPPGIEIQEEDTSKPEPQRSESGGALFPPYVKVESDKTKRQ